MATDPALRFGRRIEHLRRKAGLSQVQAAEKATDIPLWLWGTIECGGSDPLTAYRRALARLQALASTLGTTVDDLTKPLTPENT